jgi:hypothetical protein
METSARRFSFSVRLNGGAATLVTGAVQRADARTRRAPDLVADFVNALGAASLGAKLNATSSATSCGSRRSIRASLRWSSMVQALAVFGATADSITLARRRSSRQSMHRRAASLPQPFSFTSEAQWRGEPDSGHGLDRRPRRQHHGGESSSPT